MAEWSIAADCKSAELSSTLVQIQLPPPLLFMRETTLSSHYIHRGRIVTLREDTVLLSSGMEAKREIVEHHRAVVVLPVLDNGDIVLVRQFRAAANRVLLEVPAGLMEPDESAVVAAHRELGEETGFVSTVMQPLFEGFPTPGFCTEYMYFFLAKGLTSGVPHPDPDEIVETVTMSMASLVSAIHAGDILDLKTIAAVSWYRGLS
jgi:ADP-ribose pyrophosphatase